MKLLPRPTGITRRRLLQIMPLSALVAACLPGRSEAPRTTAPGATAGQAAATGTPQAGAPGLSPTPECKEPEDVTVAQTAGPFFKPSSPQRTVLVEPGMAGTRLVLTGQVLTRSCRPVAGSLVDFWQADANGEYDNAGFRLRGHQFADAQGRYRLETIVPALYGGRTAHLHVRVQAPDRPVLTTQLYFPDEPRNAADGLFRPELLMKLQRAQPSWTGAFDFVLDLA